METKRGFLNIVLLLAIGAGLVIGGIGAYFTLPQPPRETPAHPTVGRQPASIPPPAPTPASAKQELASTNAVTTSLPLASSSPVKPTLHAPPSLPVPPLEPAATPPAPTSAPPAALVQSSATGTVTVTVAMPPASSSPPQVVVLLPAAAPPVGGLPPARTIDPHAIVGIVCNIEERYAASDPQFKPVTEKGWSRGTGVFIDPRGYILTNKHVGGTYIQKATTTIGYTEITVTITTKNTGCWAGTLPQGTTLPTAEQIQTFNPTARIPVLGYTAGPLYEPAGNAWSEREKEDADFTVLKITGLSPDGPTFGVNKIPEQFPYAPLLAVKDIFKTGAPVLSYGAPADATAAKSDLFSTLYILGATGNLAKFTSGDKAFANTPLRLDITMEVSGGRSGSPVFWNGYLIGIIHAYKSGNKTQTLAVASDAVLKYLKEAAGWELPH